MTATEDHGVTILDRTLRLSLHTRNGSDDHFRRLLDDALATVLGAGADLPRILHLSVLRGLLATPAAPGPRRSEHPADPRRHLFTTPADLPRALLPAPPHPGNPHSLARLLRVFVTHLAPTDRHTATALATLIEDPGEAAVANCALVRAAVRVHDLEGEAHAWSRLRHLITRMPSRSWPGGATSHDRDVLAYLRPDHRARFDTAIGILELAPDLGRALLAELPGLCAVYREAYACDASDRYTAQRLAGRRPDPALAHAHNTIRQTPSSSSAVAAAVVSANEQILGGPELPVADPVYRLHARITARTVRAHQLGADDLTPEPVPAPLDPARLPAYAGIVRHNADTPIVAALAGRVRAEATARDDRESLLILADAGYTDPLAVLAGAAYATPQAVLAAAGPPVPELSTLLFRHRPAEAARHLSAAAVADWPTAAAVLEHAVTELLASAGPRIAHDLHRAVTSAFTCATPPGASPPSVIDGTYTDAGG
ncbi:hypothetical protein Aca07nite_25250 [Actinoplanes capillaceus]|uniref:Uncharacterized protein n=1 Tax=Actinoplanes campanulatus TaxID=113559 RepID=A0ABQ3WG53_9ACTN|nr:hypothetical protein [Actinoplanes capillaceus]GID45250.1 hypothetical protein Aca07nite_25250 [Actinoplanes capillaceus]